MPSFITNLSGGKAISGGALAPRSRRGNSTAQVASYWSGGEVGYIIATGGTENTYIVGGITYKSHKFTSSGTFTVTQLGSTPQVDVLVIAGGGGGGGDRAAGGGAGGFRTNTQTLVSATGYTVTVGTGGPYATPTTRGGNSSFVGATTITSTGGGSGGMLYAGTYYAGHSGGSGGGQTLAGGAGTGNAGGYSPVEGYNGGPVADSQGAAGGSASSVGGNSYAGNTTGANNDYETGSNIMYAYGGGGGYSGAVTALSAGSGAAAFRNNAQDGIVIIRYRIA